MNAEQNPYPALKNFIPLPSDPTVPLTKEQLDVVFGGDQNAWRQLAQLGLEAAQQQQVNEPSDAECAA